MAPSIDESRPPDNNNPISTSAMQRRITAFSKAALQSSSVLNAGLFLMALSLLVS